MKPDLDAIRARCEAAQVIFERSSVVAPCVYDDIPALLAYIDELERRTTYTVGETEWAHRIAVAEQRFVDEYDARKAAERERDEALARLPVDGSHMPSIVDTLEDDNAALRAELAELKARIVVLEGMKP